MKDFIILSIRDIKAAFYRYNNGGFPLYMLPVVIKRVVSFNWTIFVKK